MPRTARITFPGIPFHVTQRGVDRMRIFLDDDDRIDYWRWLHVAADDYGVEIHAYVLMDNHIHLVATPTHADSLGRAMKRAGQIYAQAFNRRHGRSGALFQGRYFSSPIESERHFLEVLRYVELNPVRAGMCLAPTDHPWSSVHAHMGRRNDPMVTFHAQYLLLGGSPSERTRTYGEWLRQGIDHDSLASLRRNLRQGRAVGSEAFVRAVSETVGRNVAWRPPGRPSRPQKEAACATLDAQAVREIMNKGNVPF